MTTSTLDQRFQASHLMGKLCSFLRKILFRVVSVGPIPTHISFIMDGNRRYARKHNLKEGDGHRIGFLTLLSILKYCYELKIKYISIYAFSIDNFRRRPEEVKSLMDLMYEKIEGLLDKDSIVREYGVRIYFIGNLSLLSEHVRGAAERVMRATAENTNACLLICVAYNSTDEITQAVEKSIVDKWLEAEQPLPLPYSNGQVVQNGNGNGNSNGQVVQNGNGNGNGNGIGNSNGRGRVLVPSCGIKLGEIERRMHMAVAPDPDIMIRSSGETRLSNFLLWQTSRCLLYCPAALWPDLRLWHVVWAVLNFQRHHDYLEKKRKQA